MLKIQSAQILHHQPRFAGGDILRKLQNRKQQIEANGASEAGKIAEVSEKDQLEMAYQRLMPQLVGFFALKPVFGISGKEFFEAVAAIEEPDRDIGSSKKFSTILGFFVHSEEAAVKQALDNLCGLGLLKHHYWNGLGLAESIDRYEFTVLGKYIAEQLSISVNENPPHKRRLSITM